MIITSDGRQFYIQVIWDEVVLIPFDDPLAEILRLSDDDFAKLIED